MLMHNFGFVRVTAANHLIAIADPQANAAAIIQRIKEFADSDVIVFGELSLTGYSCSDLFGQSTLLEGALAALGKIVSATAASQQLVIVGLPLGVGSNLFNVAAVIHRGSLLAIIPSSTCPTTRNFTKPGVLRRRPATNPRASTWAPWVKSPSGSTC